MTRAIEPGDELCSTYGHDYWCALHTGRVPSYGAAVDAAEDAWHDESRSWRRAVGEEYAAEIAEIAKLVELTAS